ncbi:hypothetical protein SCOR_15485 [Sulfidibacter corallicola]|uniref:Tetratricopeptide repeat protein n=1 Tax=Sulfidibacter corallicola TaxID=2818388 RepID=A0A8A4TY23_SULCO|nr:hypothetical protein [Sulfidibacter corallicola]QTD54131.1 hypothetical protein J3U87_16925 [Sulfidibacter corallicola]
MSHSRNPMPGILPLTVRLLALWLVLGCVPTWTFAYQSREFKTFFREGEELLEAGKHKEALEKFREAFRLENKAQRYRLEGAIFANYLPRYKIALAYEPIDIIEAESWIKKSEEALEEEVIRRQRREAAKYHADKDRILKAAEDQREKLNTRYTLQLQKAESLLSQRKFDQARQAYEALVQLDPNRPDGQVGLGKVDNARQTYLRSLALDAKTAIVDRKFDQAAGIISQIEAADASFAEIPDLKQRLSAGRKAIETAAAAAQAELERKRREAAEAELARIERERKQREAANQTAGNTGQTTASNQTNAADRDRDPNRVREQEVAKQRADLRKALLNTLKPYRRGDPEKALRELQAIRLEGTTESGSYHWLKSLYLLGKHRHSADPDEALLDLARTEMGEVRRLLPNFAPDPAIYPRYVMDFFESVQN